MEKFELRHVVVPAKLVGSVMEYLDTRPHGEVKILSGAMSEAISNTPKFKIEELKEKDD